MNKVELKSIFCEAFQPKMSWRFWDLYLTSLVVIASIRELFPRIEDPTLLQSIALYVGVSLIFITYHMTRVFNYKLDDERIKLDERLRFNQE